MEYNIDPYEQLRMQKSLQENMGEQQMKMYAPQLQEQMNQNQAVVISETDPKKDVKELVYEMRGLEERNGELRKIGTPMINETGARKISFLLRPIMINNTRFARLKERQIKLLTLNIMDDVTNDLGVHWREYGIKDRSTKDYIVDSLIVAILSILSRAEDQNEKNWLGKISFENVNPTQVKEKRGWLDKFKI